MFYGSISLIPSVIFPSQCLPKESRPPPPPRRYVLLNVFCLGRILVLEVLEVTPLCPPSPPCFFFLLVCVAMTSGDPTVECKPVRAPPAASGPPPSSSSPAAAAVQSPPPKEENKKKKPEKKGRIQARTFAHPSSLRFELRGGGGRGAPLQTSFPS